MRLSENNIKSAILHPEAGTRRRAVEYFAQSFSHDQSVMPLVVQAFQEYGWKNNKWLLGDTRKLPQSDSTIRWILTELNGEVVPHDFHRMSYVLALGRTLAAADPQLLDSFAADIAHCPGVAPETRAAIRERVSMLSWDGEQCWKALEKFCEKNKNKQYVNEVNLPHADHLVEALARNGSQYRDRILELLSLEVDDFRNNPMSWMEPLLVKLAGEMRFEAAIPLIVGKLKIDADYLNEQCVEALTKIGTDEVVEAVYEPFGEEEWVYRLYASGALEKIHSDLCVQRCLELLSVEEDENIRIDLGMAALSHFADEAIEPVRQLILGVEWNPEVGELQEQLVIVSELMGRHFPELDEWKEDAALLREEQDEGLEKFMQDPFDLDLTEQTPESLRTPKVGRNDPCPCGSGKKYKKCCLEKDQEDSP